MGTKKLFSIAAISLILLFSTLSIAYAHEEELEEDIFTIEEYLTSTSVAYILIAAFIVTALILFSVLYKKKTEKMKWLLFITISLSILVATLYSAIATIYLNQISETEGPVHWHADFEVWDCGKKIDLKDPEGLSNRIGTPTLHEHGDDRFHIEGIVIKSHDVALSNLFRSIGGSLSENYLAIPTNDGIAEMRTGNLCDEKEGRLQVFAYKVTNPGQTEKWEFTQEKLVDFTDYVLSPYPNVPPGDCIIIEFGQDKNYTDKICETYKAAVQKGDMEEAD